MPRPGPVSLPMTMRRDVCNRGVRQTPATLTGAHSRQERPLSPSCDWRPPPGPVGRAGVEAGGQNAKDLRRSDGHHQTASRLGTRHAACAARPMQGPRLNSHSPAPSARVLIYRLLW